MTDSEIITEMEFIYRRLLDIGDFGKAQEVLLQLTSLKQRNESLPAENKNILLG
jgi:hypothetical protein